MIIIYSLGSLQNKNVLDCFTNQGGFALSCLLNGASKVTGVDIMDSAVETAKKNSKILENKIYWINENVFDFLKTTNQEVINMT